VTSIHRSYEAEVPADAKQQGKDFGSAQMKKKISKQDAAEAEQDGTVAKFGSCPSHDAIATVASVRRLPSLNCHQDSEARRRVSGKLVHSRIRVGIIRA